MVAVSEACGMVVHLSDFTRKNSLKTKIVLYMQRHRYIKLLMFCSAFLLHTNTNSTAGLTVYDNTDLTCDMK